MTAHAHTVATRIGTPKGCASAQYHHDNRCDSADDFDSHINGGSEGTISIHLGTFRGITGGPWREEVDMSLISFVPVGSGLFVFYRDKVVAIAHVDEKRGLVKLAEVAERFKNAVERLLGAALEAA